MDPASSKAASILLADAASDSVTCWREGELPWGASGRAPAYPCTPLAARDGEADGPPFSLQASGSTCAGGIALD